MQVEAFSPGEITRSMDFSEKYYSRNKPEIKIGYEFIVSIFCETSPIAA